MRARDYARVPLPVAAVTLTSVAAAGSTAATQRVAITVNGVADGSLSGEFVLVPLQAGVLRRDSGPEQSVVAKERSIMREDRARRS